MQSAVRFENFVPVKTVLNGCLYHPAALVLASARGGSPVHLSSLTTHTLITRASEYHTQLANIRVTFESDEIVDQLLSVFIILVLRCTKCVHRPGQ